MALEQDYFSQYYASINLLLHREPLDKERIALEFRRTPIKRYSKTYNIKGLTNGLKKDVKDLDGFADYLNDNCTDAEKIDVEKLKEIVSTVWIILHKR